MSPKSYRWVKVPAQVYADLFDGMGGQPAWGLYGCHTDCDTPHPCDQRTEWYLLGQELPLLANETHARTHSYYIAQPIESAP